VQGCDAWFILLWQIAKRQAVVNPENTFFSVKRFIGRKMDEVKDESKQVGEGWVAGTADICSLTAGASSQCVKCIKAVNPMHVLEHFPLLNRYHTASSTTLPAMSRLHQHTQPRSLRQRRSARWCCAS
jgi:Hsp70 protein